MTQFQLLARRIKARLTGATYCTIENRSGHAFAVTGHHGFMITCRCSKCGLLATYDPITGLRA